MTSYILIRLVAPRCVVSPLVWIVSGSGHVRLCPSAQLRLKSSTCQVNLLGLGDLGEATRRAKCLEAAMRFVTTSNVMTRAVSMGSSGVSAIWSTLSKEWLDINWLTPARDGTTHRLGNQPPTCRRRIQRGKREACPRTTDAEKQAAKRANPSRRSGAARTLCWMVALLLRCALLSSATVTSASAAPPIELPANFVGCPFPPMRFPCKIPFLNNGIVY